MLKGGCLLGSGGTDQQPSVTVAELLIAYAMTPFLPKIYFLVMTEILLTGTSNLTSVSQHSWWLVLRKLSTFDLFIHTYGSVAVVSQWKKQRLSVTLVYNVHLSDFVKCNYFYYLLWISERCLSQNFDQTIFF